MPSGPALPAESYFPLILELLGLRCKSHDDCQGSSIRPMPITITNTSIVPYHDIRDQLPSESYEHECLRVSCPTHRILNPGSGKVLLNRVGLHNEPKMEKSSKSQGHFKQYPPGLTEHPLPIPLTTVFGPQFRHPHISLDLPSPPLAFRCRGRLQ